MSTFINTEKKCPNCGLVYRSYPGRELRLYGCPLIFCKQCNKPFWDNEIKEPALYGYENSYEKSNNIYVIIFSVVSSCLAIGCIFGGIYLSINNEDGVLTCFLLAGLFSFFPVLFLILFIYNKTHQEKIIGNQQQEYDASKERLQNTAYLIALAEHDSLAKKLLKERMSGIIETYAARPIIKAHEKNPIKKQNKTLTPAFLKKKLLTIQSKGNSPKVKSSEELLNTIEKMKKMYDDGILSQEEFEAKKADLLKRL